MAIKIALAGNPNCGKTTMFNALTGANQYVGNWPGVTVEKKEGKLKGKKGKGEDIIVTDLPGIYSLSPYTLEEVVSRDYVLKENPDVIIDLVDATNIERNLYLTTQLIETGVPVVIALNMADLLEKRGIKIDTKRLSMLLDCPIIETSALKGEGLDKLIDEAVKVAKSSKVDLPKEIFSKDMEAAIDEVKGVLPTSVTDDKKRWYAVKFLENDEKVKEAMKLSASGQSLVDTKRQELEKQHDDDMESIVTDERYKFIQKIVNTTVKKAKDKLTVSDKIDRIVTNRILGIPIFIAIMWLVYYVSVTARTISKILFSVRVVQISSISSLVTISCPMVYVISFSSSIRIFPISVPVFVRKSSISLVVILRPSLARIPAAQRISVFSSCFANSTMRPQFFTALYIRLRLSTSSSTKTSLR